MVRVMLSIELFNEKACLEVEKKVKDKSKAKASRMAPKTEIVKKIIAMSLHLWASVKEEGCIDNGQGTTIR